VKLQDAVKAARYVRVDHARRFAQHVVPEVVRPARVIWNQAIGALFLVLGVAPLLWAFQHRADSNNRFGLGLAIPFAAVMLFFGLDSFRRAKRIARR
jgi:hypothetical protein